MVMVVVELPSTIPRINECLRKSAAYSKVALLEIYYVLNTRSKHLGALRAVIKSQKLLIAFPFIVILPTRSTYLGR